MPVGLGSVRVTDSHMPAAVVFLQVVAWRGHYEVHRGRRIELSQLSLGHALDVDQPSTLSRGEQALRVGAGKGLNRHRCPLKIRAAQLYAI